MRKLSKQVSVASLSVLSVSALVGGSAFACGGMGSDSQSGQSSTMGADGSYNYNASSQTSTDSSNDLANSYTYSYHSDSSRPDANSYSYTSPDGRIHHSFYSYTSGNGQADVRADISTDTSTNTGMGMETDINILERRLDMQLRRHAMLTGLLLRFQHQQTNLQSAVESNNQALADTVNQLYPGTRDQFLQLWRNHIEYYQQYLAASERNDDAGRQQARQDLASFESDLASLFENANSQLDNANLEQRITAHVNDTVSYIDNLVSGDHSGRQSRDDMDMSSMMDDESSYEQSQ